MTRLTCIMAMIMALVFVFPIFSAFSTAPDYSEPANFSETLIEPTVMFRTGAVLATGDEYIYKILAERTNIKFKPIPVPVSNYVEKFNTTMASGDLPDMINVVGMANIDKYGPQGAFLDLTPYMDRGEMPHMVEVMNRTDSMKYNRSPDGKTYGSARIYDLDFLMDENYVIRKDVLEKNDIPMPTTWDELFDALVALKGIYPDSTPITNRWGEGHILEGMANVRDSMDKFYLNHAINKVEYGPAKQGYRDALEYLQRCYVAGVLDPEWVTLTDEAWTDKYATGKAFWAFDYAASFDGDLTGGGMLNAARELDPDWEFVPWLQPTYNDKLYGSIVLQGFYGNYRAIAYNSPYADALVRFMDWTFTDEGVYFLSFGVEGDTYTLGTDGEIIFDPNLRTVHNPNGSRVEIGLNDSSQFMNRVTEITTDTYSLSTGLAALSTEKIKEWKSWGNSYFWYKFADEDNNRRYEEIRNQLQTYMYEMSVKVIMNQMTLDEWDNIVIPEFDRLGLQEALILINEANDALR